MGAHPDVTKSLAATPASPRSAHRHVAWPLPARPRVHHRDARRGLHHAACCPAPCATTLAAPQAPDRSEIAAPAAPDAPSITTPAADGYDPDGDLTLAGTAEADSTVELFDGATSVGTTTATGRDLDDRPDRRRRRRPRRTPPRRPTPRPTPRPRRTPGRSPSTRPRPTSPRAARSPTPPAWRSASTVSATLSEALDPATVTDTSVTLTAGATAGHRRPSATTRRPTRSA